jgi:CHASE2 domain-containing sensor protein
LLSGIEFLSVLLVVGVLFLLGLRVRARTSNVVFLAIVTILILGLIYVSKVTMALLGTILFLFALIALLVVLLFRGSYRVQRN